MTTFRRATAPLFLTLGLVPAYAAGAPDLTVTPPSGSGRAGEVLRVAGRGFAPGASVTILIGGAPVIPETVQADDAGAIPPTYVALARALPGGKHDASAAASPAVLFKAAFLVRPVLTLDPPVGDGRSGATWRTHRAIATGGWFGMVFALAGTGFPADTFIPADSIRLGKVDTRHDPIRIGPDGVLPSTTIIVGADLQSGRYDLALVVPGVSLTFPAAYSVAPWAATDTIRQRGAARVLDAARKELKDLVAIGSEVLGADDLADVNTDIRAVDAELKSGNYDNAEELSRQVRDKLAALGRQVQTTRREKLRNLADGIEAGLDTIQPEGAPPPRTGAKSVADGRRKLAEARAAITAGNFDQAKALLKGANDSLRKARDAAGVQTGTEEPIRW